MKIKKIVSIVLFTLTFSASLLTLPAYAAKSADINNKQIVNKVEQFNNSRLAKLRNYIWKTNYKFIKSGKVDVVRNLITLYRKLDDLVVSSTNIADELCPPYSVFHPLATDSIGLHIDLLIMFLGSIDAYGVDQNRGMPLFMNETWPVLSTKNEINILHYKLQQIESSNKNNNK